MWGGAFLIGAATGYSISVVRSDDPLFSKARWWSPESALWAIGGSAFGWRRMVLPLAATRWTLGTATPWTAGKLWALSNYVRLGAPMGLGGGSGIGFGAAAGGMGAGTFAAWIAAAAVGGAVGGTAISAALWGKKGGKEAADFYTGGRLFGTNPNYLGSWQDPGYFHVPGNLRKIHANW